MGAEAAALEAQIAAFMRGEGGDFEALALALWALQVRENIDYQAFCRDLPAPERWWQIPAVPVTLFRDLPLTKGDPEAAAVTFRTSGTTGPPNHGRGRLGSGLIVPSGCSTKVAFGGGGGGS